MRLPNYICGEWKEGAGVDHRLIDPVSGEELATISSAGLDMNAALEYARQNGSPNLQALTYQQRAELLERIAEVLSAHRAEYFEINRRNLGATEADAAFDVDGAIYKAARERSGGG